MCMLEGKSKARGLHLLSQPGLWLGRRWCNVRKGEGLVVSERRGGERRPGLGCEEELRGNLT